MINPVNLTMTSGNVDRHLSINPVYLQSSPEAPIMDTQTFLIYEEITPYEGMTDEDIMNHLERTSQPGYDAGEDLLYLGSLIFTSRERMTWKWEGKSPGFSGEEMEVLINFIAEYFDGKNEEEMKSAWDEELINPMPPDTFNIKIYHEGKEQQCLVSNWGDFFEVQLPEGYVLLSLDENMIWRQKEGLSLPISLIDEIGYKINSYYE
jgi:hypothetical protein